jgi:hypothetical protein
VKGLARNQLLIILAAFISTNLAGCAIGFSYQSGPPAFYEPYITDLPPSFTIMIPPTTYPYWNPNRDFFP